MYLPKITVIVAVFNGAATLSRCIDSIYSQSYVNKELIIMDGGSKDGSVDIIQDNSHHIAYWESKPDRGIYHAWNKALSYAKGEWICFLGSDDYFWRNDVLDKMIPSLKSAEQKEIRLVYGKLAFVNKLGEIQNIFSMPWDKSKNIFSDQIPPHPGLMHHTHVFRDHGRFDESFRIAGDYELLLRELTTREAMFVSDIITVGVQQRGVSSSIKHLMLLIKEDISARKKHGLHLITGRAIKSYISVFMNHILFIK